MDPAPPMACLPHPHPVEIHVLYRYLVGHHGMPAAIVLYGPLDHECERYAHRRIGGRARNGPIVVASSKMVHFCAVEGGYSIAMCDGRLKEEKELLRKL